MQGEKVGGRVATWVAGVVGVWAGVAALGALVAALLSPQWALVREPMMVGEEPPAREIQEAWQGWGVTGDGHDLQHPHQQGEGSPILTTVTFRLGLWTACPHINTSHLHASQYLRKYLSLHTYTYMQRETYKVQL